MIKKSILTLFICNFVVKSSTAKHIAVLQSTILKVLRHIINIVIWTILGLYISLILLINIPAVQRAVGSQTAGILSEKLGTRVQIGRVDLGMFNRIIIDDVLIFDQKHKKMVESARISVKIDLIPLAKGKISISSAQLFGAHFDLYRTSAYERPNFQFVLDSLASKDTTSHKPLDLRINSFIMRHCSVSFNQYDVAPTPGKLNPARLKITDISAHIILKALKNDSANVNIKRISFKEQSGLSINKLSLKFEAGKTKGRLHGLNLEMPDTRVSAKKISAVYKTNDNNRIIPASLRYRGGIERAEISLPDISCLIPALRRFNSTIAMSSAFNGTGTSLNIARLKISSTTGDIAISANGWVKKRANEPLWHAAIDNLEISEKTVAFILQSIKGTDYKIPEVIRNLGKIRMHGIAGSSETKLLTTACRLGSDIGTAGIDFSLSKNDTFSGNIISGNINLKTMLGNDKLGIMAADISVKGKLSDRKAPAIAIKGKINGIDYNNYRYSNISVDGSYGNNKITGKLNINDPNVGVDIEGNVERSGKISDIALKTNVRMLRPAAINLTKKWGDANFSVGINADFKASSLNDAKGKIDITNLSMTSPTDTFNMQSARLESGFDDDNHYLTLASDFGKAKLNGKFEYSTLTQSFTNFIGSKLPTLPGLPKTNKNVSNDFNVTANITRTDWLVKLLGIPLNASRPITLNAKIDDKAQDIFVNCRMENFEYANKQYKNGSLAVKSLNDTLLCDIGVTKIMDNGNSLDISVRGNAINNNLTTSVSWDNNEEERMSGKFNAISQFYRNSAGKQTARITIMPSHININNAVWNVMPSSVTYTKNNVEVSKFAIMHNSQHIIINGKASASPEDTLTVDLRGMDIKYILDLVNFHSVDFSGLATGRAYITAPFGSFAADGKLLVSNFEFENGRMGVLDANVRWNKEDKQIDINAIADDGPDAMTYIDGYVSPSRDYIDLGISAAGTHIDFVESFTGSFMSGIKGQTEGRVRLIGPLSAINLTGQLVINGEATVRPLNCKYSLRNDTIRFVPDEIELRNAPIYDKYGNKGLVSGNIHHKHLTRLSYDLNVRADKLLAYDFHDFGESTFYGTVFGSGDVGIHGRSGELAIDINVKPQQNSTFVYNVSDSDDIANQEFIDWNDATPTVNADRHEEPREEEYADMQSDVHINFLLDCTPDVTVKLLMDSKTDDYITLNGNGAIRATYYNKGAFNMFGTYTVEHGTYSITIQDIIKKNFVFNEGGTITFGGDPYNAGLNLQAVHTVNGVSLSDLNVGNSFSNYTIRVNCLMNISGQPQKPVISFDLDMPTVSSDEKQMIRSIINSEDEMNQQVLYLLGIGRFYPQTSNNSTAQNENQQSQTSLAMQSLLSGTISTQINNVLNTVIKSNNWNFGANISTGDEGWNNAEYEGLLSGRLLNNRLLINGQFGYRDNAATANTSFIGDFDIRYLLLPSGNLAIKVYNQTNDRYFTKSSLNTQGIGLIMKKDFNGLKDLFNIKKKKKKRPE